MLLGVARENVSFNVLVIQPHFHWSLPLSACRTHGSPGSGFARVLTECSLLVFVCTVCLLETHIRPRVASKNRLGLTEAAAAST